MNPNYIFKNLFILKITYPTHLSSIKLKKMENKNYIIYKAQNTITGECYIGATKKSIEERKQDHLQKANSGSNQKFHNAINTSGAGSFTWEQLDTASNSNELAEKETKYIYKFNSLENGYNADKGGGIKKIVYQYDLNGELINTYDSLESASYAVEAKRQNISKVCIGINKTCKGFYWSYSNEFKLNDKKDIRMKSVAQHTIEGKIINNFKSASEASRLTGISKSCITKCCRGERKTSGGFIWNYL